MKKVILSLIICLGVFFEGNSQVYKTVYVDFGPNDKTNGNITTNPDVNGSYWNNATDPNTSAVPVKLIDTKNQATGATLVVTTALLKNGIKNGGLLAPSAALLKQFAIATATQDYFYTPTSGSITIKGLNKTRGYTFSLFATRNDPETRITTYTVQGAGQYSATLKTSGTNLGGTGYNGNNSTILVTKTMMPNSNGEILLTITKTAGAFAYLGALKMEEVNSVVIEPSCKTKNNYKIAWMGSSVAYGVGSSTGNQGYVYRYTQQLKNRYTAGKGKNWNVANVSVSGNNTIAVLNRWNSDLLPQCSKYVVYALGLGNEGIIGGGQQVFDQFKNNLLLLINKSRLEGIEPIIANCYVRNDFTATEYAYVQQMNALINSWNVASINLLGASDDGSGHWVAGYFYDALHPNDAGHTEFMYAVVPSLFDALDAGKQQPQLMTNTFLPMSATSDYKLEFTPEEIVHPFTVSFDVKTSGSGSLCQFETANGLHGLAIAPGTGRVLYTSASSNGIAGGTTVNNNQWHKVTLTHYYALGKTLLYIDNVLQGSINEKIVVKKFTVAGETSPVADYRNLLFYRSALTAGEVAALNSGQLAKSSLEIYAPLDGQGITGSDAVVNLAQSLNKIVKVNVNKTCNSSASLNKAATATGQCNASEAANFAVDGNSSTKWCSGNGGDKWLEINLGQTIQVCSWSVQHAGHESLQFITSDFKLQRKEGNNWIDVDAVTNNRSNTTKRFVSFAAQIVRLYITKAERNAAGVARIYEFSVYGAPGGAINQVPSVKLTTPSNGLTSASPATLTLQAEAADTDGSIAKVEFYNGSTLLGSDNTHPFAYNWTNVPAGAYELKARATDNQGAVSTSSVTKVTVTTATANSCSSVAQYTESNGYVAGSTVKNVGRRFQCKEFPYTGWCNGASWAYAPGTGSSWSDAWYDRGACSARGEANEESTTTAEELLLIPNPIENYMSLQSNQDLTTGSVCILNALGVIVMKVEKYKGAMDVSSLAPGTYVMIWSNGKQSMAKHFVK